MPVDGPPTSPLGDSLKEGRRAAAGRPRPRGDPPRLRRLRHARQPGPPARRTPRPLGNNLNAFQDHLSGSGWPTASSRWSTASRPAPAENVSSGTDHGSAGPVFVLGKGVHGPPRGAAVARRPRRRQPAVHDRLRRIYACCCATRSASTPCPSWATTRRWALRMTLPVPRAPCLSGVPPAPPPPRHPARHRLPLAAGPGRRLARARTRDRARARARARDPARRGLRPAAPRRDAASAALPREPAPLRAARRARQAGRETLGPAQGAREPGRCRRACAARRPRGSLEADGADAPRGRGAAGEAGDRARRVRPAA
jgi:hypothetical protein